ncbi:TPA: hypothetical protein ENS27_10525 [bacterium]|nr:hypothetical protein [bacterium]
MTKEIDLLVDISKLFKKYGPETFESLANLLTSQDMVQHLSNILRQTINVTEENKIVKEKRISNQKNAIPNSLTNIIDSEPEKYKILMSLYNDLAEKKALLSLRDIKDFAMNFGFRDIIVKSKKEAIRKLINLLVELPQSELLEKLKNIKRYGIDNRSLEGWTGIILNKGNVKQES